ncbi:hypothetical protein ACVWWI_003135 [Bradyrhizobium sp. USDA 3686]|uniref:hypothetical protein n=1 Tax=Bradyrhizobium TaxID=374 RepID=UPI001E60CCE3|nr:hypothetical protein [Bradyrhizobium canariense]MBM7483548.1 hypothetical protein [Bradyrhizobium canariense]UFW75302.1 hypothetical protein BcanWU425_16640 [Bradyrhizobium canariense]
MRYVRSSSRDDRRTAFDLFAFHFFEEQSFEELIDESGVNTCDPARPQSSAILQDVLTDYFDASLMNPALTGAQRLKSLSCLLGTTFDGRDETSNQPCR